MKLKLKVMQLSQAYFPILGINIGKERQINLRTVTSFITFFLGPISCAHYFFFKSKTFIEYITSCYLFCCIFICLLLHPYVVWIAPDLLKYIKSLKKITRKGELNTIKLIIETFPSSCSIWKLHENIFKIISAHAATHIGKTERTF